MENLMLCYQCGLAAEGKCCNGTVGQCGKTPELSRIQDELTGALVGLAKAAVHKSVDEGIQRLMIEGLAATAAHADFDAVRLQSLIEEVRAAKLKFVPKFGDHNTSLKLPEDFDIRLIWQKTPDIRSLKSLLLFGMRGLALYAYETLALGSKNKEAATFFHKALVALGANHFKEDYENLLKELGGISLRAMEQLAKAKADRFGTPGPQQAEKIIHPGPFIIVSGHDLSLLEQILAATADSGVSVYSHGEMLSAHGYPSLQKYPHFQGHYGTGQQNQQQEFDHIPGAVIFTSGCMALPLPSYADRVFTAGTAGIQGIPHLQGDFTPALIRSIELGGTLEEIAFPGINGGTVLHTGFGQKTCRTVSYKLAAALKEGSLSHIYVIGGCEGQEEQRKEYTELVRRLPAKAVVLTWGCTKYRFNDIDLGEVGGVPRILDLGQCGDLPLVIKTVEAIAESAKIRTEELPLTWYFNWHEERSIADLFALLHADLQNMILGPGLPPFFTGEVFAALTKEYGLTLFSEAKEETTAAVIAEEEAAVETAEPEPIIEEEDEKLEESESEAEAEAEIDIEERSEAAGLPDWAVCDDEEEEEAAEAISEEPEIPAKPQLRPEDLDQTPDFAKAESEAEEVEAAEEEIVSLPRQSTSTSEPSAEPPKLVLPKGAGVSGWHDSEEPGKPRQYSASPLRELTEVPAPPPITLPEGAGVSGFSADHSGNEVLPAKEESLYSFAEAKPEIVIPKGKGVSGWKESDDVIPPRKTNDDDDGPKAKPWLAASLDRLRSDIEEAEAPAAPQKTEGETEPIAEEAPASAPKAEAMIKESAPLLPKASAPKAKPWLAAKLKELHEDVEAAEETPTAAKNTEVKEKEEEKYVSSYRHDPNTAAAKPWLTESIENLHESIDKESGIKTKRNTAASEDNGEAAAPKWQETAAKSWSQIDTAAPNTAAVPAAPAPIPEVTAEPPLQPTAAAEEPSGGGEPEPGWQKPPVMAKPWDKNLDTIWSKPQVLAKPWEMQQPTMYHKPQADTPPANGAIPSDPEQQRAIAEQQAYEQQRVLAEQQAYEQQQQAMAEQQAYEQQRVLAEQQAYEQQQQAMAEQQAYEQQRVLAEQQAYEQQRVMAEQQAYEQQRAIAEQQVYEQQRVLAEQQAYEQQQRAMAERQAYDEQQRAVAEQQAYEQQQRAMAERQAYEEQQRAMAERQAYEEQQRAVAERQAYEQQQRAIAERQAYEQQQRAIAERQAYEQQQRAMAEQQAYEQQRSLYTFGTAEREPAPLPPNAGVSGYGQADPHADPRQTYANRPLRELPPTVPPELPQGKGISGVHYKEEPPVIPTDYSQVYGVPQKTPRVNLPPGAGISGWNDPNPPMAPKANTFSGGDFFGFGSSDAPAGVSFGQSEIVTPGNDDEFVTTTGPDGEITLTIRTDKGSSGTR